MTSGPLPLFPLPTVLFPGVVLPLHVFEPRYRELVRHLMDQPAGPDREFGVIALRHGGDTGRLDPDSLYPVGCTAELRQVTRYQDGRCDIVSVGRRRFRLRGMADDAAPYLCAEVDWLPEGSGPPGAAERLAPSVLSLFRRYLRLLAEVADPGDAEPGSSAADADQLPEDPAVLSHLVAASATLSLADRQTLLAATDTADRLRAELALLRRESGLLRTLRAVPAQPADLTPPTGPN